METTSKSSNQLTSINALRGLAALSVFAFHLGHDPISLQFPSLIAPIVQQGWSGVSLFFVISAFTLALTFERRGQADGGVWFFYLRRIFRIVPLFLLALLWRDFRHWRASGAFYSTSDTLLNLGFLFNFLPGKQEGIVWASWTLGVEMIFYSMFPFLWKWVRDISRAVTVGIGLFLVADAFNWLSSFLWKDRATHDEYFKYSILHHLPTFAIGLVAYRIYQTQLSDRTWRASSGMALIGIAAIGFVGLVFGDLPNSWTANYLQGLLYACLMIGLLIYPARFVVNSVSCFYGEISYSFYLNHMVVLNALVPTFRGIYARFPSNLLCFSFCFLLSLAVLTVLSYGTYRLIEKPGIELGRRLIKTLSERSRLDEAIASR